MGQGLVEETIKENEKKAVETKINDAKDNDLENVDTVVENSFVMDSASLCYYQSPSHDSP